VGSQTWADGPGYGNGWAFGPESHEKHSTEMLHSVAFHRSRVSKSGGALSVKSRMHAKDPAIRAVVSDDFVDGLVCSIWPRNSIEGIVDRILELVASG
jgi:hypothetical protein